MVRLSSINRSRMKKGTMARMNVKIAWYGLLCSSETERNYRPAVDTPSCGRQPLFVDIGKDVLDS